MFSITFNKKEKVDMTVKVKKPVATNVIVPPKKKKKPGNKTDYDVRISVYKSSRKRGGKNEENGIVMFADSLFELFITEDTDRIAIKKDARSFISLPRKMLSLVTEPVVSHVLRTIKVSFSIQEKWIWMF